MDLNRATILGRLTRDPEVRTTPSGVNVTSFSVATGFAWSDKQTGEKKQSVEYHNVVAWRRLGEIMAQYLHRGSRVFVEGRIQTRTWDGQDGSKKNRTEIIADNVIMLDSKSGGAVTQSSYAAAPREENTVQVEESAAPKTDTPTTPESRNEEEISVEDIPF